MTTDALDGLREKETLGVKVAAFLGSPVGIFLTQRAEAEERDALEALATVNPEDPTAIRELQAQVYRANSFIGWLQGAMDDAVAAHGELTQQERLPPEGGSA